MTHLQFDRIAAVVALAMYGRVILSTWIKPEVVPDRAQTPRRPRRKGLPSGFSALLVILAASSLHAHEVGAPFSGAIIDPLSTHHAHLEDEQRVNMFFIKGSENENGNKRFAFANELELAWAHEFTIGAEMFIPFSNASRTGDYNIGDIEIQPLKYSFLRRPETIATAVLAAVLPTGSVHDGLGGGQTVLEPRLLLDQAFGKWYLGANVIPTYAVSGGERVGLEWQVAASYSFVSGAGSAVASIPNQRWVLSPSLEMVSDSTFRSDEGGRTELSLLPGITLWHTMSGWQIHAGVLLPLREPRESDLTGLLQFGNHFSWGSLLRSRLNDRKG